MRTFCGELRYFLVVYKPGKLIFQPDYSKKRFEITRVKIFLSKNMHEENILILDNMYSLPCYCNLN
jgi:hypothetical protein